MAPSVSTSSERLALANPTRPSFADHQHAHPRRYSRWSRRVSKLQPTLYRSLLSRALLLQKYGQRVHRLALRIRFSDVGYIPGHLARIKALYDDLVATDFSELGRNHRDDRRARVMMENLEALGHVTSLKTANGYRHGWDVKRFVMTVRGIRRLAELERIEVRDALKRYPVSLQWRRVVLRRLEAS